MAGGVERVTVSVMHGLLQYGIQSFYLQDTGTETLFEGKAVDVERFFCGVVASVGDRNRQNVISPALVGFLEYNV